MGNLFITAQSGDKTALEALCTEHGALVRSVAKRFLGRGEELDDLVQVGSIGLCKAIMRFDPDLGNRFSTYAVWLISGEIRRYLRDNSPIKVSRALKETAHQAAAAADRRPGRHGRRSGDVRGKPHRDRHALPPPRGLSRTPARGDRNQPKEGRLRAPFCFKYVRVIRLAQPRSMLPRSFPHALRRGKRNRKFIKLANIKDYLCYASKTN